jgi:hypothetical protein
VRRAVRKEMLKSQIGSRIRHVDEFKKILPIFFVELEKKSVRTPSSPSLSVREGTRKGAQ